MVYWVLSIWSLIHIMKKNMKKVHKKKKKKFSLSLV